MKRKRHQTEESNNNETKKLRFEKEDEIISDNEDYNYADESIGGKKEEFVLTREIAENAVLTDISGNLWRIGAPIGKGSFGEIFLASDDVERPVDANNAKYVTKIEPHSNGPLFVEIHCLLNVNKRNETDENVEETLTETIGIPKYIASGSHHFDDCRYRFLIMPRYKTDLHSITKNGRLHQKHFLIICSQIIDVLMHLHSKQYVHSDIKAENIMMGLCKGSSFTSKLAADIERKGNKSIQFSGTNPMRSCRGSNVTTVKSNNTLYDMMVKNHYLRPSRRVAYADGENSRSSHTIPDSEISDDSDQDEDFELTPRKAKRRALRKSKAKNNGSKSRTKNRRHSRKLFPIEALKKNAEPLHDDDENEHVYIIDYGLATKFIDTNGEHRPFCMDQRRAHDGTLEFTSRDAHFGAHSRRSDLECFGYNLIYWSQGFLPWKDEKLKEQPEIVHRLKEVFMTDVKEMLRLLYGKEVPRYLGEYMQYVSQLAFDEKPDYEFLKGLFETEFIKLGYKKSDMKLNLNEMRDMCVPIERRQSEQDLMMASITDLKTAKKLGFLIATDSVDGTDTQSKPNESISLAMTSKASPKNLRSKEKTKTGKRPKKPKATEKELISEKMARGKKLSIHEIATLDPDQIARDRAEKEYERLDDKIHYQTLKRYSGNPTYAILELENKLKNKLNGSAVVAANSEIETIKGYTKPMMDILRKQQMHLEQQLQSPVTYQKKDVIKAQKNLTCEIDKHEKVTVKRTIRQKQLKVNEQETIEEIPEPRVIVLRKRGRPFKNQNRSKIAKELQVIAIPETPEKQPSEIPVKRKRGRPRVVRVAWSNSDDTSPEENSCEAPTPTKKKRGRPKIIHTVIEPPETEEDSVYFEIPGEGSNYDDDDEKEMSDDDNIPLIQQRKDCSHLNTASRDEESTQESVISGIMRGKKMRGRYYNDDDFEVSTDETSNLTSISNATRSAASTFKARRHRGTISNDSGIATRNKVKSRSTSRSVAALTEISEQSEHEESDYELRSESEELEDSFESGHEETDEAVDSESEIEDSEDSIDIKYSPIKTRHARRDCNVKNARGRRLNIINENASNYRMVSAHG